MRGMKPFIIFALWAIVGWDVGAWAEAITGVPSAVGILAGVAIGAAFAVEARRRIVAAAVNGHVNAAVRAPEVPVPASSFENAPALDRAA